MKIGTVTIDGRPVTVVSRDGRLVRLDHAPVGTAFVSAWVASDTSLHDQVAQALTYELPPEVWVDPETAIFLPPIPDARLVIAIGLNYASHCREQGKEPPATPVFFAKLPSCLTGHRQSVVHWPVTSRLDFEGELAVVIGRGGRAIPEHEALSALFGYSVFNDVTARDLQRSDGQWVRGKSLDTFGPMGPLITLARDVPDPQALRLQTRVNGELRQDASTAEMAFGVARIVAHVSQAITLRPGDVITTGTPAGVGVFASPPRFLEKDDRMEVTIEGLGTLSNTVAGPD